MDVGTIANAMLGPVFAAARVPLRLVGQYVIRTDADTWSPLLAVDEVEATVNESVGSVLHSETLKRASAVQRERISRLKAAARLEDAAVDLRHRAGKELDEIEADAEAARRAVRDEQAERLEEVEQQ